MSDCFLLFSVPASEGEADIGRQTSFNYCTPPISPVLAGYGQELAHSVILGSSGSENSKLARSTQPFQIQDKSYFDRNLM